MTFSLPKDLQEVYQKFGFDIAKHNGMTEHQLPIPSTFILNRNKQVLYSFGAEDYTQRLDPQEIIEFLEKQ